MLPIIIASAKLLVEIPIIDVIAITIHFLSIFLNKEPQSPVLNAIANIIPIIAGIGIFSIVFEKNNVKRMKNKLVNNDDTRVFEPFSKLYLV
jgi:hypothetical protein